ncbi:MAG: MBL fold metallo-hydrolase [Spirochaetes bacterium]|nr:MBL fold metallo-hydrolase [Spirochaetota bacterium]
MFKVKFWGVRGSIPCPGPKTAKYGGNTSCIQIKTDLDYQIIIDAGTGLRSLGASLLSDPEVKKPLKIFLFLSHTHWDHIMGFPFFAPIYMPDSDITIFGPVTFEDEPLEKVIGGQLTYKYFPLRQDELRSNIKYQSLKEGNMQLPNGLVVSYKFLNHPILCLGYRFEYQKKVFCTCYDHEPFLNLFKGDPVNEEEGQAAADENNAKITAFFNNADLLVHDSQYTSIEYKKYTGWGHSTYKYAIDQALKGNVKRLALFHHDPERSDAQLNKVKNVFGAKYKPMGLDVFPAKEQLEIEL